MVSGREVRGKEDIEITLLIPGVLMWEVFTCGKMPYGRLKNTEVVERVQRGIILERPKASTKEIYDVRRRREERLRT